MTQARHLAAILFTDIVGYTAMMQANEQQAVAVIKHYNSTLEILVSRFSGQIVNYYGDGSLCIFHSATDAARCSLELQKELKSDPVVPLRIGIHIGEVFFENEKALGDGVNVASRVQSLGQGNTVLVSGEFYDKIKNNASFSAVSLGHFDFKNISKPLEIFALSNDGLFVPQRGRMQGKLTIKSRKTKIIAAASMVIFCVAIFVMYKTFFAGNAGLGSNDQSIAVLPFANMSNDPNQEYFSEGISDEIINLLSEIPELKVIARTSSFSFKGKSDDIRAIGEKLGVARILDGSVRKSGNIVRITAQLIRVEDGSHEWSATYEREMDDIFIIQDEIAESVTNRLKVTLFKELGDRYRPSQEAYDLYLKGRYFWNKRGKNLFTALDNFKQAVAIDSLFAQAHAGIAETYVLIGRYNLASPHQAMPLCRKAAEHAIQLDENCVEASTALAYEMMIYEWKWDEAEQMFKRAIDINPKYTPAHYLYGQFLSEVRRDFDAAKDEGLIAIGLEPLNPICHFLFAMTLEQEGKYNEALNYYNKAIELNESTLSALYGKARTLNKMEQYDKAIGELLETINKVGREQWMLTTLCESYVFAGEPAKALHIYEELKNRAKEEYISALFLGFAARSLNKDKEAKVFFGNAIEERSSELEKVVAIEKNLDDVLIRLMKHQ